MAMASPISFSTPGKTTSFTDCRNCGCLCLGATILPCGHVTCRKCLRHLQKNKLCPDCETSFPVKTEEAVSGWTEGLSAEFVLHDLVYQRLQDLSQQSCHVCQTKDATMICQDCLQMYCDACSVAHGKMRVSGDHVQQPLPRPLCNAPPGATATTGNTHKPQSPKPTVTEVGEDSTTQTESDRQWVERQVQLLKKTTRDVKEIAQAAQNVFTLALQVAQMAERRAEILDIYTDRLSNVKVTTDVDGVASVSGLNIANVKATVKALDLQKRLRDVRRGCREYDVMVKLRSESSRLMKTADNSPDLLTATPRRVFETTAVTDQDTEKPYIHDVLTLHDGRLLMADLHDKMLTALARMLSGEHILPALKLERPPVYLSILSDRLVAVTAFGKNIYLVDVSGQLAIKSLFQTKRQYRGVTDGPDDDTLLVSCHKDNGGPAGVDVIRRDGSLVRTVIDGDTLTGLERVSKICVVDGHVLIPDCGQDCVYRVEVTSGRLVEILTHPDLKGPVHTLADDDGNVYIVCVDGESVVVCSCEGEWRRLLHGPQHGSGENSVPGSMCLTKSGIVVTWLRRNEGTVVFDKVIEYTLLEEENITPLKRDGSIYDV
ncbi:E3 ubiquitin-protein ligase TRIM71-like [Littorina saxatilis]|uniref:Uncharacterized protein n=1 Tax=Littorina saxatilis TaxID=31220 RepID=A0AAN9AI86_9CAEN